MKTRTTTALIATAMLTLALPMTAAPAAAQRGEYRHHYPDGPQMERVAVLAHQIDESAREMLDQYERNNRRPDRREAWVRASLQDLSRRASRYHDGVESYRRSPRRTSDSFEALLRTYDKAERSLSRIAPRPYVNQGMGEISEALTDLSRLYGRTYRIWRNDDDRRDDRDGRDRDGRDRDRGPGHH